MYLRSIIAFIVSLSASAWAQEAAKTSVPKSIGNFKEVLARQGVDWCGTQEEFEKHYPGNAKDASCFEGSCDNPANRNPQIPDSSTPIKTVHLFFNILRETDGSSPAADAGSIAAQMATLNATFAPGKFQFLYDWRYVDDSRFRALRRIEEEPMKALYAVSPDTQLNVYVLQSQGGYAGLGTFPWDARATTVQGGIIMDEEAFGAGQKTLTHEVGHCLGLWHTHHGVSEVELCSACYERATHTDADRNGDFCSDTAATPVNFQCSNPNGLDPCSNTGWGQTDTQNYMGYAPDQCLTQFSAQQMGRMHCWSEGVLRGWFTEPGDGRVVLDRDTYNCGDAIGISLADEDLSGAGTAAVSVSVDSGDVETVVLAESSNGNFSGLLGISTGAGAANNGVLNTGTTGTITVVYQDQSNAANQPQARSDTAALDCEAPEISNVRVAAVGDSIVRIAFDTDATAKGTVLFGAGCASLTEAAINIPEVHHSITLTGLTPGATYRFKAKAIDAADNAAIEDNGGACYEFTTHAAYDYLTETFLGTPDLQFLSVTFTPDSSPDGYRACVAPISALPTSIDGATLTPLFDDATQDVSLGSGHGVPFYGATYDTLYLNANGNITFDSADISWEGTIQEHLSRPRVSAMFTDINLADGGELYRQELEDRFVATWVNASEFGQGDASTFQIELYYSGAIRLSYLQNEADGGTAGISPEFGAVSLPQYSDLSAYGECFSPPYIAGESLVEAGTNVQLRVITRGLEPPLDYAWTKNGQPVGGNNETLNLVAAVPADSGTYRATVFDNGKASYPTAPFLLHVTEPGELPVAGGAALFGIAAALAFAIRRKV